MKNKTALYLMVLVFSGCTIAPHVTQPEQASPWAKENVVAYDQSGIFVKSDWIRVYHALLKAYGDKLPINEQVSVDDMSGITPQGSRFHVSFTANKRFTDLKYIENGSGP